MSTFDDVRKLFQDIVAPDLRALAVRIDALDRKVDEHFAQTEKIIALNEKLATARHDNLVQRFEQSLAQMQINQAAVLNSLQVDRRLERLERNRKPHLVRKDRASSEPGISLPAPPQP